MALLSSSSSGVIEGRRGATTLETFKLHSLPSIVQTPSTFASSSSLRINGRIVGNPKVSKFQREPQKFCSRRSNRQLEQFLGYRNSSSARVGIVAGNSGLVIKALQGAGRSPRRLVDVIRAIPILSKAYFKSPFRRALYGGISLLGGFYVAQTISLSFGALGVNDVIAAAMCVLFAEYVTRFYYTREKVSFTVALVNNFKMGFTYGLFIDAFKLAS